MTRSISVTEAMDQTPRDAFLPEYMQKYAHINEALPIGFDQTCSQPSTVAEMLEWLSVRPGDHVLDVGSGSGWTTAILSKLVGQHGHIDAVEIVPELVTFGKNNCLRQNVNNAHFHTAGTDLGWPKRAPYERILVSASRPTLPQELINQLTDDGIMVAPVGQSIFVIEKHGKTIATTEHYGYEFVPLL